MGYQHRLTLRVALLAALSLAGCGKKEVDPEKRAQALAAKGVEVDKNGTERLKLKSRVQAEPKSGEARFALGKFLLAEGDAAAAAIELQRAQEFQYPDALVLPFLTEALVQSNQARRVTEQYAETQLGDPAATARLQAQVAMAWLLQGDNQRAGDSVARALAADPKSAAALVTQARMAAMANDVPAALATLDRLLADQPNNDEAWSLKGDMLLRRPDGKAAAIEAFTKALQAKPDQIYAHAALLSLQLSMGNMDAAKKQFKALAEVAPKSPTTALYEAHLAYASGDHARARDVYQTLLRGMPENVNVLLSAGENELAFNAPVQAEALFAKASALAPRNALARRLLGQAQIRLGQASKALITLGPLVDDPDASAEVLWLAAQARQLNGEPKLADALYARMARLKPTDPKLRTIIATARLGKESDGSVFNELQAIAKDDQGTSADLALISAQLNRGQLDAALQSAAALQAKRPKEAMGYQLLGQIQVLKNDNVAARKSFEQALGVEAGYFPAVNSLAALDVREGKPDAARERFAGLLKSQPNNASALLAMAELQQRQGAARADVLKLIDNAVKVAPSSVDARVALISHHFNSGNIDAALTSATAATVAIPGSLELLELLGRCQQRAGQSSQAITTYGKIVSLFPKSPRGHLGLTEVYIAGNQLEQAQKSLAQALDIAPNHPEAMAQSVIVAVRGRKFDSALATARKMQTLSPARSEGYLMEGEIEIARSNWDAAAAVLRKAVELPDPGAAPVKLHNVLRRGNKSSEAAAFAERWLKAHPNDVGFLFYLGDLAQQAGDNAGAEARYQAVLKLQPDHVLTLNNLAMLHIAEKKPDAVALAERALQGAPDQPALLDTLAQALAANNNLGKAIESQKRAVAIDPGNGELRLSLAKLHLQNSEKALAKAELEKLKTLGDKFASQAEVNRLLATLTSALPGR